jgi:hypothetical protein
VTLEGGLARTRRGSHEAPPIHARLVLDVWMAGHRVLLSVLRTAEAVMSGIRNLREGIDSINRLKRAIRELPLRMQAAAAADTAGFVDVELRADFAAGQTVYDTPRSTGAKGNKLSLVDPRPTPTGRKWRNPRQGPKSMGKKVKGTYPHRGGHVRDSLGFTSDGRVIRAVLGQQYARYLVGKYWILPMSLPYAWRDRIKQIVDEYFEIWAHEQGLRVSR